LRCSRFSAFSRCFCCRASSFNRLVAPGAAMTDLPLVKQVQCPSGRALVKPLAPPRSQSEQAPGRGCRGYSRAPTSPRGGKGKDPWLDASCRSAAGLGAREGQERRHCRRARPACGIARRYLHRAARERGLGPPSPSARARPSCLTARRWRRCPARPEPSVHLLAGSVLESVHRGRVFNTSVPSVPTAGGWCTEDPPLRRRGRRRRVLSRVGRGGGDDRHRRDAWARWG
jgi:hypothetical protein